MQEYLIILPLPEPIAHTVERFVRAGVAFLEAVGRVKRQDFGSYARSTRSASEVLHLIALSITDSSDDASCGADDVDASLACARSLEAVLRSALGAAKVTSSDVRVCVLRPKAAA